ncbi:MAG: amidohydrolase [Synergistaceae bacterium]|jgi:amidohydrolase|nr:amidohydrolase [Synergistaceae bacterium]
MDIRAKFLEMQPQIVEWRRELHRAPEVGFDLPRTEAMVLRELAKLNLDEVRGGMGGGDGNPSHGVIATLSGALPGKTLALRADMDALPVAEETGLPFASENGNMHACGHDAHVAMLLSAAKFLSEAREELRGRIRFIFQPSEENFGSPSMIASGALENPAVDGIIGLHTGNLWEGLKPGQIGFRVGEFMAASDLMSIAVYGKDGHGAMPHNTVDAIAIAAQIITELQTLVSREISPFEPAVVSIGEVKAGSTYNIIAGRCDMKGTLRTFKAGRDVLLRERVRAVTEGVAASMRGRAEVNFISPLKAVINDRFFAEKMKDVVTDAMGSEMIHEIELPASVSEDFCWYLTKVPGAFFAHCSTFGDERDYPHHHPKFDVNESVLWTGGCALGAYALNWQK